MSRRINPNHAQILAKSAIGAEDALEWGIFSCSTPDGLEGTDIDHQGNRGKTGIVFPLRRLDGSITYQMRVDDHQVNDDPNAGPVVRKYAQAAGVGAIINVPAMMADRVGKVSKVLVVEGTKQTIAASLNAAEDVLVFGIQGARNWSVEGVPLQVLCDLVPAGSQVWLGFDADWQTNPDVWAAAKYLKGHLETGAGADKVRLLELTSGAKTGLDDFLGSNPDPTSRPAMLARLMDRATPNLGRKPAARKTSSARLVPGIPAELAGDLVAAATMGELGLSVPELIESWAGRQVQVADGVIAVLGGDRHGVWLGATRHNPITGESEVSLERVADYVAWRSAATRKLEIGADGIARPVAGAATEWAVEIVRGDGRRWAVDHLSDTESTDIAKVADAAGAAVAVPGLPAHRTALGNVLRVLGHEAGRDDRTELTSTGWMIDPEHGLTWAAPAGSMTTFGPITTVTVGPPLGSEVDSLPDAMAQLGWDRVAEGDELREGTAAFAALIAMAPKRPEVGVALVGGMAAALLHMSRRCAYYMQALPQVGKGHLLGAAHWFWSPAGPSAFTVDLPDSSRAFATAAAAWARDGVVFADDFKLGGENDTAVVQAFGVLARGSYSGAGAGKSTKAGGFRRRSRTATIALMAGEETHPDQATMERLVVSELVAGDVDKFAGGPIDAFAEQFGHTGLARATWASFVRWLARYAGRRPDPLSALRDLGDTARAEGMALLGTARSGETVSVLLAGWVALSLWAAEEGVVDVLPDMDTVVLPAMRVLADQGATAHAEANPAERIIAQLRKLIASGRVTVEDGAGANPNVVDATVLGWVRDERATNGVTRAPTGICLRMSNDRAHIVITPAAADLAVKTALMTIGERKRDAALSAKYAGGATVRCSSALGVTNRARGWVVPVGDLGLDAQDVAPQARPAEEF